MGAFLTSLLQSVGRTGNEAAEGQDIAKRSRFEEEDRKLKLLQSQLGLSEVQQKLKMNAAPQYVGSHEDPKGQIFNTKRNPLTGDLTDQPGGKGSPKESWTPVLDADGNYVAFDKTTGKAAPLELDGKQVKGAPKGKSGPLTVDGKPVGIWRGGKPLTPDSPEWAPSDAVQFAGYLKGYVESEANKDKRIKLASESRVEAYMKTRMYGAMDAQNGSLVFVSPDEMRKSPGRYAPAGPSVQAKNRIAIFNEIDTTKTFLNDAIGKLPDDAFSPEARLQISYALRDEDPKGAWHNFLNSDVAATLTPEQINYVTSLVSMDESAMSLRSIAGMGAGSDMLRGAIFKMLPGAGTPSKAYAIRQMKIFDAEVQALKTSVPNIGEPGQGGGQTKGQGNQDPMKLFTP